MPDDFETQLSKAQAKYDKILDKIDFLNEEAYELEKEMMYLTEKMGARKKK